ncbi:MAG TPA: hypothetical protein VGQ83_11380 [Polyangia bacterium]|jgi:hypothetical protein
MSLKVTTPLDEVLVRRAEREAQRQGRALSDIVEEALDRYLIEHGAPRGGAVAQSWGAIRLDPAIVQQLLDEDDGLLDA